MAAWQARVLTLFPQAFPGPLGISLAGKALEKGLWALDCRDIRDFAATGTVPSTTRPLAVARGW